MRPPRMTTRRWMRVVVGAAVATWLVTVAYRVQADPHSRWVQHLWLRGNPVSVYHSCPKR